MITTLLLACAPGLSDVTLDVDFEAPAAKESQAIQTPSAYRVALFSAELAGDAPHGLLRVDGAEVFEFVDQGDDARSLVAEDPIPERDFHGIDLGIAYLEMDLDFRFDTDGSTDVRTLRIWFEPMDGYLPGDVTVAGDTGHLWVFGAGNVTGDPLMQGLDRDAAYGTGAWPDGRLVSESGPFGNQVFWDSVETEPFRWHAPFPDAIDDDTAHVVVRVADTWHFTDQGDDGVYDWPTDYGNAWNMDFPDIVVE